ncbi:adenine phosphoribosyltransferase [[Clostridium] spiroforme]|nr:adenine phosphoribosyltransferase [Thomasclavelia spiroformis]MBM6880252.1 adenine phosphoribosyltransferase [Thomasclavelia spiroformis]MBM6930529.1 adenine phosphoribosyltransferase [Thomasclavelia spiroformis]
MDFKQYIADIPDFPEPGIIFRDVTPLLKNKEAYHQTIAAFKKWVDSLSVKVDVVAGPEARGFIFGCPVAYEIGAGFVPVRKPGKLPRETVSEEYALEYGTNEIQIHADSIQPGENVIIVDDLLATGGTVEATVKLIEKLGGKVVGIAFLIELEALKGREKLNGYEVCSLVTY